MTYTPQQIFQAIQAQEYALAEGVCRQRLAENPNHVDWLHLLGVALHHQGKGEEGATLLQKAVDLKPGHSELYNSLAIILSALDRREEALAQYEKALQYNPNYVQAWYNVGRLLKDLGRSEQAQKAYEKAIQLKPDYVEAYNNLANLFKETGQFQEAETTYLKAVTHDPGYAEAHDNLGIFYGQQGEDLKALHHYQEAIRHKPEWVDPYQHLALLLQHTGYGSHKDIHDCYDKLFALNPEHAEGKADCSLITLLEGDYPKGWALYEWRRKAKVYTNLNIPLPEWDGKPLGPNDTLFIYGEQGLGDAFQFMRYLPIVRKRVSRIVYRSTTNLHPILKHVPGIDVLVQDSGLSDIYPQCTHICFSMSLPHLLGTRLESIPPVLEPESWVQPAWTDKWAARLVPEDTLKVGLVWASRHGHQTSRHRSIPIEHLLSLAQIPGVTFYNLQKGPQASEFEQLRTQAPQATLIDLSDELHDLTDTVGVVSHMDLVITVDTLMAHLAASLNKPTWVLLAARADWRWLVERNDSPWYPSARLFRQDVPGNWPHVVQQVYDALIDLQTNTATQKDSVYA